MDQDTEWDNEDIDDASLVAPDGYMYYTSPGENREQKVIITRHFQQKKCQRMARNVLWLVIMMAQPWRI